MACRFGCCAPRPDGASQGIVRALDLKGLAIGETRFEFPKGALETKASFDLPVDLRNDIARLEILDQHSTGAVSLLDARWKRRTVGHRQRRDGRCFAAAAGAELLSA